MKHEKDQLKEAVEEWMRKGLREIMEMFRKTEKFPQDPAAYCHELSELYCQSAENILKILGRDSLLKTPEDVGNVILSEFLPAITSSRGRKIDNAHLIEKITQRLRQPLKTFQFSVAISAGSKVSFQMEIGGIHKLKIHTVSNEENPPRMKLQGQIEAPIEEHAVPLIEQQLKFLLGACMALGIAGPLPNRTHLRSKIEIEGGLDSPYEIEPSLAEFAQKMVFGIPLDLDELESRLAEKKDFNSILRRRVRPLPVFMNSNSSRAKELRNAASLFCSAVSAPNEGMAISFAFMSIEAVLLESNVKENILARLAEAVAYRLGKSSEQRRAYRKLVKDLYDSRSLFVHTGEIPKQSNHHRDEALTLAASVLRKEIEDLIEDNKDQE